MLNSSGDWMETADIFAQMWVGWKRQTVVCSKKEADERFCMSWVCVAECKMRIWPEYLFSLPVLMAVWVWPFRKNSWSCFTLKKEISMTLYLVLILMHKPDLHWNFVVSNHHCSFILLLQENKCHICTDVEPQRSGAGSETLLFLFFHRLLMLQLILDVFVGSSFFSMCISVTLLHLVNQMI